MDDLLNQKFTVQILTLTQFMKNYTTKRQLRLDLSINGFHYNLMSDFQNGSYNLYILNGEKKIFCLERASEENIFSFVTELKNSQNSGKSLIEVINDFRKANGIQLIQLQFSQSDDSHFLPSSNPTPQMSQLTTTQTTSRDATTQTCYEDVMPQVYPATTPQMYYEDTIPQAYSAPTPQYTRSYVSERRSTGRIPEKPIKRTSFITLNGEQLGFTRFTVNNKCQLYRQNGPITGEILFEFMVKKGFGIEDFGYFMAQFVLPENYTTIPDTMARLEAEGTVSMTLINQQMSSAYISSLKFYRDQLYQAQQQR